MSSERERVLELLKRHGFNATSFQVLEPGFSYWFDGAEACVAYADTGSAWVAAGAPLASPERLDEVARRFLAAAKARGRRGAFFATEENFARRTSLRSLHIGEQPVWDPRRWDETLRASRGLREQLRRARAKRLSVREVPADAVPRTEAQDVVRRWLDSRPMAPMGFLVQLHLDSFASERRCFLAEQHGRVLGLLHAIPVYARGGWFFEDLLRAPDAPNGTSELLVDAGMRAAAESQSSFVTLGMVPLSGETNAWLNVARALGRSFYDFEGLRAFKARLRPHGWSPVFLSFPKETHAPVVVLDALRAFARGGLVRFGLATLLRGPTALIRWMALLLVPWTLALALADTDRWFPGAAVKWSWVTFDALLAAALLALTFRWRRWLGALLAVAVSADALLTLLQAALFNLPRASGAGELAVTALAVAAPTFSAFLLWRAYLHREA